MSVLNNSLLLGAPAAASGGVSRSLRFNSADSAYLSRTPGSAGDRNKWTFSCWVKLGAGLANNTFSVFTANSGNTGLIIRSGSGGSPYQIEFATQSGATVPLDLITTRVFRDYGAWFHLLFYFDLANSTQADRAQIYINGVRETNFSTNTNTISTSSVGRDINNTSEHRIGAGNGYADGYLADIYFIDGQALDPTNFGEFDATTGVWNPKAYTGSYGTNGFHLEFADNSAATATTLGKDTSGNGNNWTPNNLSVTAGAGNDSLVDTPTNSGTDTASGGVVTGNYCVWNGASIGADATLSNGNLDISYGSSGTRNGTMGTFGMSSGKWYWEVTITASSTTNTNAVIGISNKSSASEISNYPGFSANGWGYYGGDGKNYNNGVDTGSGATYGANDVIGVAFDADAGTLVFYKNGTSQGTAYSGLAAGTYFPGIGDGGSTSTFSASANFGQRPFTYQTAGTNRPASTYKALCTANLPTPSVTKPSTVFDAKLWTGNGSSQSITTSFSPDFVWIKQRNSTEFHRLFDVVRGANKQLYSNSTSSEDTSSTDLSSFDSGGFTVGSSSGVNGSSSTYVGWAFDAGSSTVTNTAGSITSSVRANATAGFSIVTYTGTGATGGSVGHGLGVAPGLIIVKNRDRSIVWVCYHSALGAGSYLFLNTTDAKANESSYWGSGVTSTVFGVQANNASGINYLNEKHVAYCFAPVSGYSSFGSYTGNGSSDGPFVYTGHRSRFLLIKCSSLGGSGQNWIIVDTSRDTYNISENVLRPNLSDAEVDYGFVDVLSNGFKLKNTDNSVNGSGQTYVYMALAESPFNYARAR
jgi:hypothetical protein